MLDCQIKSLKYGDHEVDIVHRLTGYSFYSRWRLFRDTKYLGRPSIDGNIQVK